MEITIIVPDNRVSSLTTLTEEYRTANTASVSLSAITVEAYLESAVYRLIDRYHEQVLQKKLEDAANLQVYKDALQYLSPTDMATVIATISAAKKAAAE